MKHSLAARAVFSVMVAVFCAGFAAVSMAQTSAGQGPILGAGLGVGVISVQGQGRVSAPPDMAIVNVGVSYRGETAETAMARVANVIDLALARVTENGVARSDVQTGQMSLYPVHRPSSHDRDLDNQAGDAPPQFEARSTLTLRIRNLPKLGNVIAALMGDGINRIDGLQFVLSNSDRFQSQARTKAVKDAMTRAKGLADAAGVTLGAIVSLSEGVQASPQPMMQMATSARSIESISIAEGEVAVVSTVSMRFAIADQN
jgi:uncharacterized protein YggE